MSRSRGASARRRVGALMVVALCGWVCARPLSAAAADAGTGHWVRTPSPRSAVVYRPPVDAPVSDPFRPPATPYGPGNRGIEYATVPGTLVRSAADGHAVFAGPVAGGLHVTIRHADGVRTSYSFLAAIRVHRDQAVRGGDVVGVAAALLHVGARRGDTYIDPASLWGSTVGPPDVHLVPLDGFPSAESPRPADRHREGRWLGQTASDPAARLGLGTVSGVGAGISTVAGLRSVTPPHRPGRAGQPSASAPARTDQPWWTAPASRYTRSPARHPPGRSPPPRLTHGRWPRHRRVRRAGRGFV